MDPLSLLPLAPANLISMTNVLLITLNMFVSPPSLYQGEKHGCMCSFCINSIIRLILKDIEIHLTAVPPLCLSQVLTEVAIGLYEMFGVIKVPMGFT